MRAALFAVITVFFAAFTASCGGSSSAAPANNASAATSSPTTTSTAAADTALSGPPVVEWRTVAKILRSNGLKPDLIVQRTGGLDSIRQGCDQLTYWPKAIKMLSEQGIESTDPEDYASLEALVCDPAMDPEWVVFTNHNKFISADNWDQWSGSQGAWLVGTPKDLQEVVRFAENVYLVGTFPIDLTGAVTDVTSDSMVFSKAYQALLMEYDVNTELQDQLSS